MDRNKWLIVLILAVITGAGIVISAFSQILLLDTLPWLMIIAVVFGIASGVLRARTKKKSAVYKEQVTRHGKGAFLEHWGTALGIILLIISGFMIGFLFFPHFAGTPKAAIFPLNMHYIGILITFFGGFYFLTDYILSGNFRSLVPNLKDIINGTLGKYLLRKKWVGESKYLSSQKSAFLLFALLGGMQLVTGSIKVAAHFWSLPSETLAITTSIHDVFSLLFIIMLVVHISMVIIIPSHRELLKSWFSGKVSERYAKEYHSAWYEEIKGTAIAGKEKENSEEKA